MQGPGEGARTGRSRSTSGTFCGSHLLFCAPILTPAVTHPLSTLGASSLSLHQCGATAARNAASCPTPGAGRSIPWRGPESPTCGLPFPGHFTCRSLSCFFHPTAGLRSPRGRGRWLPPPRVPSSLRLGGPEVPCVGASACPASLSLQIPPRGPSVASGHGRGRGWVSRAAIRTLVPWLCLRERAWPRRGLVPSEAAGWGCRPPFTDRRRETAKGVSKCHLGGWCPLAPRVTLAPVSVHPHWASLGAPCLLSG